LREDRELWDQLVNKDVTGDDPERNNRQLERLVQWKKGLFVSITKLSNKVIISTTESFFLLKYIFKTILLYLMHINYCK
jgi:hypothetical protein